jgi:ATP-dependent DNA ligase
MAGAEGFIAPMEARLVDALPEGTGWQFEPKWDGFRCIACRDGARVSLYGKSGKPLERYFPEVATLLGSLRARRFVLDGELTITPPDAVAPSFDALQMRLHPAASRILKLSRETPARYVLFDLLREGSRDHLPRPLLERRAALEAFVARTGLDDVDGGAELRLSPATTSRATARRWLGKSNGALDGLIAKRLDGPYVPGERAMLKFKPRRTADCVVGGFRYATGSEQVGSLLLGLYDDQGLLNHVGFTSSIPAARRAEITRRVVALRGGPGFTGRAPGGPSRWSTERSAQWEPLRPKLVVEVSFDHVTSERFRHGTRLLRWRPDKDPRQCRMEQITGAVG